MFNLPDLPYAQNALEPHIDEETMHIHHEKHHAAYVTNLNAALETIPEFQNSSIEDLIKNIDKIPEEVKAVVRNNGGGHQNHSLFWTFMSPQGGGEPEGKLREKLDQKFGSFSTFR